METLLFTLIIGVIAGWLATVNIVRYGFGLRVNIVIGVIGSLLGAWLFPKLGVAPGSGFFSTVITATLGACIILAALLVLQRVGLLRKPPVS